MVYITTPIPSHFPVANMLLSNGVASSLFVEKTLASSYKDAAELCKLVEKASGVNMVGYMKRFAVTFRKAKDILLEGSLGEMVSFDAYAYSSDFANVKKGSKTSAGRGGVLEDLGSHVVDLALWFFGDLQVRSAELKFMGSDESEDEAVFRVEGDDEFKGNFSVSWCRPEYRMPEFGLIVRGTKGVLTVDDDEVKLDLNACESRKWYRHDLNDNVGFLIGGPEYFR